jgi:hypothetical protein
MKTLNCPLEPKRHPGIPERIELSMKPTNDTPRTPDPIALAAAREIFHLEDEHTIHGLSRMIARHYEPQAEKYRTACILISEQTAQLATLRADLEQTRQDLFEQQLDRQREVEAHRMAYEAVVRERDDAIANHIAARAALNSPTEAKP